MSDEFEELARISASGAKADLEKRIDRERRVQTRSRRIRKACRYIILIAGGAAFGLLFLGLKIESNAIVGLGFALFLPTLIAATVLFFMGGLAPTSARLVMTNRERDLLDK